VSVAGREGPPSRRASGKGRARLAAIAGATLWRVARRPPRWPRRRAAAALPGAPPPPGTRNGCLAGAAHASVRVRRSFSPGPGVWGRRAGDSESHASMSSSAAVVENRPMKIGRARGAGVELDPSRPRASRGQSGRASGAGRARLAVTATPRRRWRRTHFAARRRPYACAVTPWPAQARALGLARVTANATSRWRHPSLGVPHSLWGTLEDNVRSCVAVRASRAPRLSVRASWASRLRPGYRRHGIGSPLIPAAAVPHRPASRRGSGGPGGGGIAVEHSVYIRTSPPRFSRDSAACLRSR
jgi:hypothetical protein